MATRRVCRAAVLLFGAAAAVKCAPGAGREARVAAEAADQIRGVAKAALRRDPVQREIGVAQKVPGRDEALAQDLRARRPPEFRLEVPREPKRRHSDLHFAPGGRESGSETRMFHDAECAARFLDVWRSIAARFLGNADVIYGYDLVNEPVQRRKALPGCDGWTLQRRAAEAIREIDPETPVIVESNLLDHPETYGTMSPLDLANVIYEVHVYNPVDFTHQGVGGPYEPKSYPDVRRGWDKDFLRRVLAPVRAFEERHGAKIYVGEFSAIAWADGADKWLADAISLFDEYGWDWTYHAFREWSGWSVEHEGPDAKHMVPSSENPRRRVLLDGLKGGADRESSFPTAGEKAGQAVPASR